MKQEEWKDKMSYHVSKEDFQNHEILFDTVEGNEIWGKCLVVNIPTANGSILQAIIMRECEEKEIKEEVKNLCEKYKPQSVLEVGFGLGYTATQFQECGIKKHVIVEAHPQMVRDAKKWKENYPNRDIEIVHEFLQDYAFNESNFDLIYDDRYEIIDRDKSFLEDLVKQGFMFRGHIPKFPCWKIMGKNKDQDDSKN